MSQLIDENIARQFDRLPPSAVDAERCMLASMMLDKEMIGEVVQKIDREAFFQSDQQVIFDVLLKLYEAEGRFPRCPEDVPAAAVQAIAGQVRVAAAAWQCVAAIDALQQNRYSAATVSVVGCNQQAIAARFVREDHTSPA